jgi:diguanylate cyclase
MRGIVVPGHMDHLKDGHRETFAIANTALARITAHGQPADPRSYELWYQFATGRSGLLCAAVDSRLDRNGTLSRADIDEIYNAHVAPTDASVKVEKLGARMAGEIEHTMAMLAAAEDTAVQYSARLAQVSDGLAHTRDRRGARAMIESLLAATREMAASNVKLQDQLQATWEEVGRLRRELESVRTEHLTDALTALGNRKFFDGALAKAVAECHAENAPLGLLLADVDDFKTINESYGHVVGDRVLRFVAGTLKKGIKGTDIAARFGGEEFAVILPRTTLRGAIEVAEQLRRAVMKAELIRRSTGEKQTRVTISIGVAALHHRTTPQALLEAADLCLCAAKRSGRNCVVGEKDARVLTAMAE